MKMSRKWRKIFFTRFLRVPIKRVFRSCQNDGDDIPLDPVWISWNKVRPRLTRAISPKPWSLGGRFSVCQSWCCGFVTDPRPLVAATSWWPQCLEWVQAWNWDYTKGRDMLDVTSEMAREQVKPTP
ncbi:hypothetical protein LAZ67_10003804, partial [Cordylochernes scorpioides]